MTIFEFASFRLLGEHPESNKNLWTAKKQYTFDSQVINKGELHGVILITLLSSLSFGVKEMAVSFQSPENIQ